MKNNFIFIILGFFVLVSCRDNMVDNCPSTDEIVSQFIQPTGEEIIINNDGQLYQMVNGECSYAFDYYDASFPDSYFSEVDGDVFFITPDGNFPATRSIREDFERYESFVDLFYSSVSEIGEKYWGIMTLQSPHAKTVEEYVALRKCILDGSCDFLDNKIELVTDPVNLTNQCLKFTAVYKTEDMVTCKSSISTPILFFEKGDDFWFEADFYIDGSLPTTLVDFENEFFEGFPGPRILISNNKLTIENKFGSKEIYRHDRKITVPKQQCFSIKIHLIFDESEDGLLELWQEGELLFSQNGINIPLANSIHNRIEIGLSATSEATTVYVDNVRIDDKGF